MPVALRSSVTVFPVGLTMTAASVVPFGGRIVTWDDEIETADRTSETRRPAVPWKVRRAFCPGVPSETASGWTSDDELARDVCGHVVQGQRDRAGVGGGRVDDDRVGPARGQELRVHERSTGVEERVLDERRAVGREHRHVGARDRHVRELEADRAARGSLERQTGVLPGRGRRNRHGRTAGDDRRRRIGRTA